ncbi:CHY zinc finger protein [Macrococcus carouselicus]|uniref:CHY-type domain-containing protein n=1 Tax=Macrococcus carouselicus TaxID=69969 RepID=A0A9Q8CKB8_9STAP|nr:CHY zinc finger protein [Macrococcus carouselicus]TDL96597.1 hypothetical protein ERX40_09585 [Macrococcus carouselicus]
MIEVKGAVVDHETRCIHYHSELDIIAIKFKCCGHYYPCYQCHNDAEDHDIERWPLEQFDTKAVLCGSCQYELAISEYMKAKSCPACAACFNEGCSKHYPIYFKTEGEEK